jgi:hypothetical protein
LRPAALHLRFVGKIASETTVIGGFLGSAVVSTASVGVPPTESSIRPQPTNNSERRGPASHRRIIAFYWFTFYSCQSAQLVFDLLPESV